MNPPGFLVSSVYVAIGGGIGSWLRFAVARVTIAAIGPTAAGAFPWATLIVNVVGSFAMGLLASWLARFGAAAEPWRLLLGVGVLGGFTTFSAFSLDFVRLAERGAMGTAALYVLLSLVAAFAGLLAGLFIVRGLA